MRGADIVADKVNVGRIFLLVVLVAAVNKLDRGAGAEIRTADADDNKHIAHAADFFRGFFYSGKLGAVISFRKLEPAEKIRTGAAFIKKRAVRRRNLLLNCSDFRIGNKTVNIFV